MSVLYPTIDPQVHHLTNLLLDLDRDLLHTAAKGVGHVFSSHYRSRLAALLRPHPRRHAPQLFRYRSELLTP